MRLPDGKNMQWNLSLQGADPNSSWCAGFAAVKSSCRTNHGQSPDYYHPRYSANHQMGCSAGVIATQVVNSFTAWRPSGLHWVQADKVYELRHFGFFQVCPQGERSGFRPRQGKDLVSSRFIRTGGLSSGRWKGELPLHMSVSLIKARQPHLMMPKLSFIRQLEQNPFTIQCWAVTSVPRPRFALVKTQSAYSRIWTFSTMTRWCAGRASLAVVGEWSVLDSSY